jgi:hypothetical protein
MIDTLIMVVPVGAPLPNPGQTVDAKSGISEKIYEVRVKQVKSLRWHRSGDLIVEFTYSSRKLKVLH